MEPVGSTYIQSLVSGSADVINAAGLKQQRALSSGSANGSIGSDAVSGAAALQQKGFQSSGSAADEFKPYSRYGALSTAADAGAASIASSTVTAAATPGAIQDPQVQAEVDRLKAIEEKVKAHEAAHKSAGGAMTGQVSYSYTRGPDGRSYITGGEVSISVTPGKTPQETVRRMQQVIQAALAPADPSPQDRAVAAQAAAQQQEASQKLASVSSPSPSGENSLPPLQVPENEGGGADVSPSSVYPSSTAVFGSYHSVSYHA